MKQRHSFHRLFFHLVFSITVDPDNCEDLRDYICGQWDHHESGTLIVRWETPDLGPQGLPEGGVVEEE